MGTAGFLTLSIAGLHFNRLENILAVEFRHPIDRTQTLRIFRRKFAADAA